MIVLIPLILISLYVGMYILRTNKTGQCRWRQTGKDDDGIVWRCPVCGVEAKTEKDEPRYCGRV